MSRERESGKMGKLLRLNLTVKILLVLFFEVTLGIAILMIIPFDSSSIQVYELFVFGDLLAVMLLNPWSVFIVAGVNSLFIVISLLYQPHTAIFNQDLQFHFWSILLCPISVQFLVALLSYLGISSAYASIKHAHNAEIKAKVAQQLAEAQKVEAQKNMMLLQNSVERIVHRHALVMNQRLFTKIPLTEYEPVLWPLINAFNSLQSRLHHTHQIENELHDIHGAISTHLELIGQGKFSLGQSVRTHTVLDMLLNSLYEMQKAYSSQKVYPTLLDLENTSTLKLRLEDIWITNSQELYARGKQLNWDWESDYFSYARGDNE